MTKVQWLLSAFSVNSIIRLFLVALLMEQGITATKNICNKKLNKLTIVGSDIFIKELDFTCNHSLTHVDIFASNSIVFNDHIDLPGIDLSIVARKWVLKKNRKINLNGRKGAAYESSAAESLSGAPGRSGMNAGNFIGIGSVFKGFNKNMSLTIDGNDRTILHLLASH